jgi:hypothetical protein
MVSSPSAVVRRQVPRVIQADFGTQHNRAVDVLRGIQRIFRVLRGESGTLPFLSSRKSTGTRHEPGIDLAIHVVHDRSFGRSAAQYSGPAKCTIGSPLGLRF